MSDLRIILSNANAGTLSILLGQVLSEFTTEAQAAANAAAVSAAEALADANNASTSQTAAANSATAAAASATNSSNSASAASTSAGAAATSATTASNMASSASTSAGTATAQAGIATAQAGIATTQAGLASGSATAAATSATNAAATLANALTKANNLSDVANVATARSNLGAAAKGANGDITSLTGLTVAPLARAFNAYLAIASGAALTAANVGNYLSYTGATGTATLAQKSTVNANSTLKIRNEGTGALTISPFAGDTLTYNNASISSIIVRVGQDIEFVANSAANTWTVSGGSAAIGTSGSPGDRVNFTATLDATQKIMTATWEYFTVFDPTSGIVTRLPGGSKTFNVTTVGQGGVDVAGAPYASCPYIVYVIYNPTTGDVELLGQVEPVTGAVPLQSTYSGAHPVTGYTASGIGFIVLGSAIVGILNGGQFVQGRRTGLEPITVQTLTNGLAAGNYAYASIAATAKKAVVSSQITSGGFNAQIILGTAYDTANSAFRAVAGLGSVQASGSVAQIACEITILTPKTIGASITLGNTASITLDALEV